jgi:hypothetical protein
MSENNLHNERGTPPPLSSLPLRSPIRTRSRGRNTLLSRTDERQELSNIDARTIGFLTIEFITDFLNNNVEDVYLNEFELADYINDENLFEQLLSDSFENDRILQHHKTNYEISVFSKRYKKIKNKERYKDEKTCSICLCDYEDDDRIATSLDCHHIFHKKCIQQWGKTTHNCPICRTDIPLKEKISGTAV